MAAPEGEARVYKGVIYIGIRQQKPLDIESINVRRGRDGRVAVQLKAEDGQLVYFYLPEWRALKLRDALVE